MLAAEPYADSIEQWRREREENLKSATGWLTIAGLQWLREGRQTVGSDPANDIVLPPGAPAHYGYLVHEQGQTWLVRNGRAGGRELLPDSSGQQTVISIGHVSFWVIQRGDRYGIRIRDRNSRFRREFTQLRWYPVKPEYRVEARFVPHPAPLEISVPSVIGVPEKMTSPGRVVFSWNGQEVSLLAVDAGDSLWFIFRDKTAGVTTYGAGRFLYSDLPKDGKVTLDFNKAYNPPCAFTPYATCPLPPRENRLPVAIEAGEMDYPHNW